MFHTSADVLWAGVSVKDRQLWLTDPDPLTPFLYNTLKNDRKLLTENTYPALILYYISSNTQIEINLLVIMRSIQPSSDSVVSYVQYTLYKVCIFTGNSSLDTEALKVCSENDNRIRIVTEKNH